MRPRRMLSSLAVLIAAVGLACVVPASAANPATRSLQPEQVQRAAAPAAGASCHYVPAVPVDKFRGIPSFSPAQSQPFDVRMVTTQGTITFRARTGAAPCTTFSFRFLAQRGYFTNTHCHRLTTQGIYVLQCGDPTGTGSGGPGYEFADENLTGATYPAGTVAMANAGPEHQRQPVLLRLEGHPAVARVHPVRPGDRWPGRAEEDRCRRRRRPERSRRRVPDPVHRVPQRADPAPPVVVAHRNGPDRPRPAGLRGPAGIAWVRGPRWARHRTHC